MTSALKNFLNREKDSLLENCILCGICLSECPIIPFTPLKDHDPVELQQKILDFLARGTFSQEAYDFGYYCLNCAACDTVCPVDVLRPSLKRDILRAEMSTSGKPIPVKSKGYLPASRYHDASKLMSLQIKPSEIKWLENMPQSPKQTDIVFFLGCFTHTAGPDKVFTAIDVLYRLKPDFIVLAGGDNRCCGNAYAMVGDSTGADKAASKLMADIAEFQPKIVVCCCPTCTDRMSRLSAFCLPSSKMIEYQHLSTYLADNLGQLSFTNVVNRVVTVHDPCHLARGLGEFEGSRKILSKIPGLSLVEMAHNKQETLCCGGGAGIIDVDVSNAFTRQRLEEAMGSGADTLATLCPGCYMTFLKGEITHSLSVKLLIEIVGEALGIQFDDKFRKLARLRDPKKIIDAARENIDASIYSKAEMLDVAQTILKTFNQSSIK